MKDREPKNIKNLITNRDITTTLATVTSLAAILNATSATSRVNSQLAISLGLASIGMSLLTLKLNSLIEKANNGN